MTTQAPVTRARLLQGPALSLTSQAAGAVQLVLILVRVGSNRSTDAYFYLWSLGMLPTQILCVGVMYPLLLNRERIARTGQALGLTSDARSRFERGVDPAFLDEGLAILTGLILDICGGEPSAAVHVGHPPVEKRVIAFDFVRTKALGGIDVPEQRQREILNSLGFEVDGDSVTVVAPSANGAGSPEMVAKRSAT